MKKRIIYTVLVVVLLGAIGYVWLQPRPSADWAPGLSAQLCPLDRTAVVTVVQLTADQYGAYNGASLVAYNQYGETLVSGPVEVVWRRGWRDPVENKLGYTGYYLTVDRDLYYGLYNSGPTQTFNADATGPEMLAVGSEGKPVYYKGLTGTSVSGKSVVPISALTGSDGDRQQVALGLLSAGDANQVVTCQKVDGSVESIGYGNVLRTLEDVGGGGRILFTDSVLTGTITPVDSESHQYRLARGDGLTVPDRIIQPQKGPLNGQVIVEPGVELLTFNKEKTGRYWWLALLPRPKGVFNVHVTGLNQYDDDWAQTEFTRRERPGYTPTSQRSIDPLAISAINTAGVPLDIISQGYGHADASGDTHELEPGSNYTDTIDFDMRSYSDDEIRDLLHRLRMVGFAAFYRPTLGDFKHIHAVYAGACRLKASTDSQVHDFLNAGDGLVGDNVETNMPPTEEERRAVAKVYANPRCTGDLTADTIVTQTGSGSTLHPLQRMDGVYSGYFGRFYPDGYYGGMPVGHWDVGYDRGRIIPPELFLNGSKGKIVVPITNAYPAAITENCTFDCSPSKLLGMYGVYMMLGPWQDAGGWYTPNGGLSGFQIGQFTYDYDHPDNPVTFDYDFSTLTQDQRRTGYKWGISLVLLGNNPGPQYYNDVIYLDHVFVNSVSLPGEPIGGMMMEGGYGGSGIVKITNEGMPFVYDIYPVFMSNSVATLSASEVQLRTAALPTTDDGVTVKSEQSVAPTPAPADAPADAPAGDTSGTPADQSTADQPVTATVQTDPAVPAPVPPKVPSPTVAEMVIAVVVSIPDQIIATISPKPAETPVIDTSSQAAAQLAAAKTHIAVLTDRQNELARALAAAKKSKKKAVITTATKLLNAAKKATTAARRSYNTQNRAYVSFVRAKNQLTSLRSRRGTKPSRALLQKIVVAERTYAKSEKSLRAVFTIK